MRYDLTIVTSSVYFRKRSGFFPQGFTTVSESECFINPFGKFDFVAIKHSVVYILFMKVQSTI